jgi:hypothetical protein
MENLNRSRGGADFHRFAGQRIGNAIPVAVEGDVIIDVHARLQPVTQVVSLGGQRLQSWLVEAPEQAGPALIAALAEGPVVQVRQQFADCLVGGGDGEEPLVTQPHDNPALYHLHRTFRLWPYRAVCASVSA